MLIAALFTIAKTWKQSKYKPTDEWKSKQNEEYSGILFSLKKKENFAIWYNMDEP